MKKEQMRELTREELLQRKLETEEELFNLRLQKASKELDNPLRLRVLRKELARINTILREDELKIRTLATGDETPRLPEEKQEQESSQNTKEK
ncbi:MAG: 50S ribosomal protein L29 [candidate division Zixibacteria bacterium]|nr:50S ribosomal protein L29 [candidate division Zixibacteria bacterium]